MEGFLDHVIVLFSECIPAQCIKMMGYYAEHHVVSVKKFYHRIVLISKFCVVGYLLIA